MEEKEEERRDMCLSVDIVQCYGACLLRVLRVVLRGCVSAVVLPC